MAGSVAVHMTTPPEVKVTVPVAPGGRPEADTVTVEPGAVTDGETFTVMAVFALITVNCAPVAVAALSLVSPE